MTTPIADAAQPTVSPADCDTRALHVAQSLRDTFDFECVILFGSRARGDWTDRSDIDLMIIEPAFPDLDKRIDIECIGRKMIAQMYDIFMSADFVFLSRAEYERKSVHTLNHVSRFARREGILIPRNLEEFPGDDVTDDPDHIDEPMERRLRIADANTYYQAMHDALNLRRENKATAYHAQQTLEHAMKALISAQGYEAPHLHELDKLLVPIQANDPNINLRLVSDLGQLTNFAGGDRYGPLLTPVTDYTDMANRVTDDLNRIYGEITRLTGENPWAVPPEGGNDPIQPRRR